MVCPPEYQSAVSSVVEKVTVMHNGKVLKTGTPEQIENDAQVQAIYMGGKH